MYYVIIDLEWNQYHNPLWTPTSRGGVKMHEEIIQIGAVKTDHLMNPVDTFKMYVRLAGGRRLDRYVKKLTHISDQDISSGEDFAVAAPMFCEWLKDVDGIFSWGPDDKRVFLNNLSFHNLPAPACAWYDAQRIYSAQVPKHGSLGLKNIAEAMGVYANLTLHDALNDAVLTVMCMRSLDVEAGVSAYASMGRRAAQPGGAQVLSVAKTHRHASQQAAWEEACQGLLRCPECMQPLEWAGDERGSLERWYKPAKCVSHGDYIIRGEFMGQKACCLRLTTFRADEATENMLKQEFESPAPKKRRRRRRRKTAAERGRVQEDLLAKAVGFAAEKHKSQTRKGESVPYIVHPMEACAIVATMSDDMALIAAAALHDTVEDCADVTPEVIEKEFGAHVAELVALMTEERGEHPAETWKARKQSTIDKLSGADEDVLILALGDKLSNLRALYRDQLTLGDKVYERFHQTDKKEHAWYYRSLLEALSPLERFPAYQEYSKLVDTVFGKRRARAKRASADAAEQS